MVKTFRRNSRISLPAGELQSEMVLPGMDASSRVLYVTRVQWIQTTNRMIITATVNPHDLDDERSQIIIDVDADFPMVCYETVD